MKSESENTWGETISVKFYLNKKLKPVIAGKTKRYSLYARVVCKKQVCDYKVTEHRFTEEELDHVLKGKELEEKLLEYIISHTQADIRFIVDVVHPFDRDDFILRNLPEVLRLYHELAFELHSVHGLAQIRANLVKNGYAALIEIIDWKQKYPDVIAFHLEELQRAGKIKTFKIWNNYKPALSLAGAVHLLTVPLPKKRRFVMTAAQRQEFIQNLIARNYLHPEAATAADETLRRAIEFANHAMKLTTR